LGDGGRRERALLEAVEHLCQRPTVRALDERPRDRPGERRHPVLQLRELIGDIGGQQIAPRGDRLPELHEDGTELLECMAQTCAAAHPAVTLEPH
jgi:hypothetical protein